MLFPPRCVGCGSGGVFLCEGCARSLARAAPPRCSRCWQAVVEGESCLDCHLDSTDLEGLRAAYVHQGVARDLVHGLKYRGMTALAGTMGDLLAKAARQYSLSADVIVPVPLAGSRQRTRGYNQARILATALGRELDLPVRADALGRTRSTPPQARSLDADARRRNVAGAFSCRKPAAVEERRVLLVDDVATTGATLAACARAMTVAGAESVWGLVFARED